MKKYQMDELIIYWKPELCQHAGECVNGLLRVFVDVNRKPWIVSENGTKEDIMKTIDKCP